MHTEPVAISSPVSLREVRAFCYWSQCYLQRVIETTPIPHSGRVEIIIRELQQVVLSLSESPRLE